MLASSRTCGDEAAEEITSADKVEADKSEKTEGQMNAEKDGPLTLIDLLGEKEEVQCMMRKRTDKRVERLWRGDAALSRLLHAPPPTVLWRYKLPSKGSSGKNELHQ